MSYLQRLLDTGSPTPNVAPVAQSQSPIAQADQRLLSDADIDVAETRTVLGEEAPIASETHETIVEHPFPEKAVEPAVPVERSPNRAEPEVGHLAEERLAPLTERPSPVEDVADSLEVAEPMEPGLPDVRRDTSAPAQELEVTPVESAAEDVVSDDPVRADDRGALKVVQTDIVRVEKDAFVSQPQRYLNEGAVGPVEPTVAEAQEADGVDHHLEDTQTEVTPVSAEVPPLPLPEPDVQDRVVERVIEQQVVKTVTPEPAVSNGPTAAGSKPQTASSVSRIGPLPRRQKIRYINGMRWT